MCPHWTVTEIKPWSSLEGNEQFKAAYHGLAFNPSVLCRHASARFTLSNLNPPEYTRQSNLSPSNWLKIWAGFATVSFIWKCSTNTCTFMLSMLHPWGRITRLQLPVAESICQPIYPYYFASSISVLHPVRNLQLNCPSHLEDKQDSCLWHVYTSYCRPTSDAVNF